MDETIVKKIAIFGSTGSIGTQALEIIALHPRRFRVVLLSCRKSVDLLREQIAAFQPLAVAAERAEDAKALADEFPELQVFAGADAQTRAASELKFDVMLNALVGIAGLMPTLAAIENYAGRSGQIASNEKISYNKIRSDELFARDIFQSREFSILLANKETLVTGGRLVTRAAAAANVAIVPVDSEHSAIFQCLAGSRALDVEKIILTASGGPFRGYTEQELAMVRARDALAHPNWAMGAKITVDSATMINKAFEIIEAKWLFELAPEQIEVLIHPKSIVHSLVVFRDGASLAQLGLPSMKVPISYALFCPERPDTDVAPVNLAQCGALDFYEPTGFSRRGIALAYRVLADAEMGNDSTAVVLNGADELLTELFLKEEIAFLDIIRTLEILIDAHDARAVETPEEILALDLRARADARKIVAGTDFPNESAAKDTKMEITGE